MKGGADAPCRSFIWHKISFEEALKILTDKEGSDLYYSTGAPPSAKIFGVLSPFSDEIMKPGEIEVIANSIMDDEQRRQFKASPEMNMAISRPGLGAVSGEHFPSA